MLTQLRVSRTRIVGDAKVAGEELVVKKKKSSGGRQVQRSKPAQDRVCVCGGEDGWRVGSVGFACVRVKFCVEFLSVLSFAHTCTHRCTHTHTLRLETAGPRSKSSSQQRP